MELIDKEEKNMHNEIKRLLLIKMAGQPFAIPLDNVNEAIGMQPFTKVPQSKAHCLGIINLRGTVVSLLDLAVKLNLRGPVPYSSEDNDLGVVISILDKKSFGLVVDSIESVFSISSNEIKLCPMVETNIPGEFITGVTEVNNEIVIILNILPLFGIEDLNFIKKAS
jgi:purine-binding chemotaxis protein CheW